MLGNETILSVVKLVYKEIDFHKKQHLMIISNENTFMYVEKTLSLCVSGVTEATKHFWQL